MMVYVAVYEHDYGTDIWVLSDRAKAQDKKDQLADEWWKREFPDEPKPEGPAGDAYFDLMSDRRFGNAEYFSIYEREIE